MGQLFQNPDVLGCSLNAKFCFKPDGGSRTPAILSQQLQGVKDIMGLSPGPIIWNGWHRLTFFLCFWVLFLLYRITEMPSSEVVMRTSWIRTCAYTEQSLALCPALSCWLLPVHPGSGCKPFWAGQGPMSDGPNHPLLPLYFPQREHSLVNCGLNTLDGKFQK